MSDGASSPSRGAVARQVDRGLFAIAGQVMATFQRTRAEQFTQLGALRGAVVFLGDSITEGGLWSEWFPDHTVSNRGIGGETTHQVLRRLDSAVDHSRAVFVLAGTNDLTQGETPPAIATRLERIVDGVAARAPATPVLLQGVMPRKPRFATEILKLNTRLHELCEDRDHVRYLDLWPALAGPDLGLRSEFTNDSLHLNGRGYAAWVEVLRPAFDELT